MFMSLKVHLTSQAPNRQHPPGPSVLFNGSLSFNEHLSHDIVRFAEAGCSEPFRQPHSGHEKPPGHIWGSQLSLHSQAMGVGVLGQGKHCRGVTDLPVRCSSSQSPWPPPPCPPSWGVSPFICTFSPPEYMFFLGKDTARHQDQGEPWLTTSCVIVCLQHHLKRYRLSGTSSLQLLRKA